MRKSVLAVVAAALMLAACDKPSDKAAVPITGELNLYTARHYDADLLLYDAFTRKTGIKVNRLEIAPDQMIERMKAEGEYSPADVILMADAGGLWKAQQAGLFQPIESALLEERLPQGHRDAGGAWWAFSRRARVIAYDKTKVKPEEVATYEALAGPRFKGGVCVRSSENDYNLSLMAALIEHWGRDKALAWAKGVVANFARQPVGGDIEQIRAVGAGLCQVALTNTYYYLRIAASENGGDKATAARVALAFPEQQGFGTHVNLSGGGVAAHAQHRAEAVKFLEFLTSDEAQEVFARVNHEYPAVPTAPVPADVAAVANFKADPLPAAVLGQRRAEAQAVYDEAGWR
jgi:iron(III) transport system substrate-binding protein